VFEGCFSFFVLLMPAFGVSSFAGIRPVASVALP
jgi:hypothetical protein